MEIQLIVPNEAPLCIVNWTNPVSYYGPRIAEIAGGFTAYQATGSWTDDQGKLIVEEVTVFDVSAVCPADADRAPGGIVDAFRHLAGKIADELKQLCVYLRIDDTVEYIRPE
jgi:hypothetical protein